MIASPASSNLIKLIKSLKQKEKRLVTLELSRYRKENNLLKLYQLINGQDVSDDDVLRKKIKDKKFKSQLNINKHKLYHAILELLQQVHLKSSPYYKVQTMLQQAYLLYSKGMIQAKEELLLKARDLAKDFELREFQLQIINLQQSYQWNDDQTFCKEVERICIQLKAERKLNQLFNRSLTSEHESGTRLSSKQKSGLKKLADEALRIKADSFTAQFYRLRIRFSYFAIPGDHPNSCRLAEDLIRLFRKFPHMLQLDTWRNEYLDSLKNFIPAFTFFGKTDSLEFIYQEAKKLDVPEVYQASFALNILDSYIQTGEFKEHEKKINDMQKHIAFYKRYLSVYNIPIFYFNLALMNFGMQHYSKSLFWLNEIINIKNSSSVNITLQVMTRLIRLIVFYELNYSDVLENQLRSTARFISKQKEKYRIDELILKCIRKLNSVSDKKERLPVLKQFKHELLKLSKDEKESGAFYYFDFISWLDCQIEQRPFALVVKEKNAKRLKK